MLDRREFLKRCYKIGGVAAIIGLGISAVEDAMGWGILPAVVGGGGGVVSWANWDEKTQGGLAGSDIYVCFGDASGAGDDDVGEGGGMTGANLVLVESGNIPAATGSPPYRQLTTASEQFYTPTQTLCALIKNQADYTIVIKILDWADVATASPYILDWRGGATLRLNAGNTTQKLDFTYQGMAETASANNIPSSGVVYLAVWRKNGAVKAAFKAVTRPTKESDFAAGDTVESTDDTQIAGDFSTSTSIFSVGGVAYWPTLKFHYIVIAKKALFT